MYASMPQRMSPCLFICHGAEDLIQVLPDQSGNVIAALLLVTRHLTYQRPGGLERVPKELAGQAEKRTEATKQPTG